MLQSTRTILESLKILFDRMTGYRMADPVLLVHRPISLNLEITHNNLERMKLLQCLEPQKPLPALTRNHSCASKCQSEILLEQTVVNDKMSFLGDARLATVIVSSLTLLGILISLAAPVIKEAREFWIFLKVYYLIACLVIIVGIIAILQVL